MNAELDFYSGAHVGFEIGDHDRATLRLGLLIARIKAWNKVVSPLAATHAPPTRRLEIPARRFLTGLGRRLESVVFMSLIKPSRAAEVFRPGDEDVLKCDGGMQQLQRQPSASALSDQRRSPPPVRPF